MYVKKAERLQIELLDEYLQELGYPDHWKKFIEEEKRKEYLIIKSKNKCHCLYCNEEFQSNAKVNEYITCPNCNMKLKIKSNSLKKYESRKEHREVSFETLISEKDISVPFLFHINSNAIEDYIENEKLYQIISNLKPMQKKVLKLKIVYQYTLEQIAKILNRSNSRIKHIYSDTIREIVKKMEE